MIDSVPNYFIDFIVGKVKKEAESYEACEGEEDRKISWARLTLLGEILQMAQASVDINKRTDN